MYKRKKEEADSGSNRSFMHMKKMDAGDEYVPMFGVAGKVGRSMTTLKASKNNGKASFAGLGIRLFLIRAAGREKAKSLLRGASRASLTIDIPIVLLTVPPSSHEPA